MEFDSESATPEDEITDATARTQRSTPSTGRTNQTTRMTTTTNTDTATGTTATDTATATAARRCSVKELVVALSNARTNQNTTNDCHDTTLSPELQRRVLDFALAQRKRHDKYGVQRPWGIFGMYAHLDHVRIDLEWAEDAAWRRHHGEPYLAWADFDQARQTTTGRPYWTISVIAICTLMLLVEFAVNDWRMAPINVNPMVGPTRETLVRVGARDTVRIVEQGEWFRLITPLVLHAGLIHYAINMLAYWFIGGAIEQSHGVRTAVVLFLIPGIGGNVLSAIFLPQFISVGASGGIFGLIGGCVADISMNWNLLFIRNGDETSDAEVYRRNFVAVFILVVEILINILCGLVTPVIDNWSHVGGFLYGALCALTTMEPLAMGFFGKNNDTTRWAKFRSIALKYGGLIFSAIAIFSSTIGLANMSDPTESPCHNCRYISCVPFPFFRSDKWWYCDDCDFVTADLFKNGTVYSSIDLTCPDESLVVVDISSDKLSDRDNVRKRLPTYCREQCGSVYN